MTAGTQRAEVERSRWQRKLRGRSLAEVAVRGRQELAKFGERVLAGAGRELSDAAFIRAVSHANRRATAEATAAAILTRIGGPGRRFFASVGRVDEVDAIMRERYPSERRATLERADRAIAGEFALLGLERTSFGFPIDWRLEPLSGRRAPLSHWSTIDYLDPEVAGDKRVTWELNRHAHFVSLAQAFALTRDERYARALVDQATSWMDANPPGLGINWTSSLEVAFRSISWLWALHLAAHARALTPAFALRALKALVAHGNHVETYLSHFFSPNTHLTGEALGLFHLGTALPELAAAEGWRATGLRILTEQIGAQVRDDGVYFEQSTYYHRYTADFYLHAAALAHATGGDVPQRVALRLADLVEHLVWVAEPGGTTPLVGDDDGGRLLDLRWRGPRDFRDTVAIAAALFGVHEWRWAGGERAPEVLWLLGPDGHARYMKIEGRPPSSRSRVFRDGGLCVLRDGWTPESGYALVDCGPHGSLSCGHAHADALSVTFGAHGVSWLVDPGTFTYTGDARLRDAFRTTAAHNTATVDDEPQSEPAGPFSWSRIARSEVTLVTEAAGLKVVEGRHDGYARLSDPVLHSRSVLFVEGDATAGTPPYLVLRDAFDAADRHEYAVRYHLPAASVATVCDGRIVAVEPLGGSLAIAAMGAGVHPRPRVDVGWVSEAYAHREQAPVAVFEIDGSGPQRMVGVVVPSRADEAPPLVSTIRLGGTEATTVDFGAALDVVLPGDGRAVQYCFRLRADGELAWARLVGGRAVRACVVRGGTLEIEGQWRLAAPGASLATVAISGSSLAILVEGAPRFELTFGMDVEAVAVAGTRFEGGREGERTAFVRAESGWRVDAAGRGA